VRGEEEERRYEELNRSSDCPGKKARTLKERIEETV